jgi:hypothetical protein
MIMFGFGRTIEQQYGGNASAKSEATPLPIFLPPAGARSFEKDSKMRKFRLPNSLHRRLMETLPCRSIHCS